MYVKTEMELIKDINMSGEEKILYIILLGFCNQNNRTVYPSRETLMQLTGWKKQKLDKTLKSLEEEHQLIKKTRVGKKLCNRYEVYDYMEVMIGEIPEELRHLKKTDKNKTFTKTPAKGKNKFHNFDERTYDFDKMQKQLLDKQRQIR